MKLKNIFFLFFCLVAGSLPAQLSKTNDSVMSANGNLPWNRLLQPAGKQIIFGNTNDENHALDAALSPDGKWLAVEERFSIVFIDTKSDSVVFSHSVRSEEALAGAVNTYSGIIWYTTDSLQEVLWSAVGSGGKSFVIKASWNGKTAKTESFFTYYPQDQAESAIPNELLIRHEKAGDFLYVVLNGNNEIIKQNLKSGKVVRKEKTGVAPYGIAEADGKLYVTNWGGRLPLPEDTLTAGVPWGKAHVSPLTGGTSEGSVSVYDAETGKLLNEILTGLHPNEIVSSPDQRFIYITNANSDNVSVIETASGKVSETIPVRLQPDINKYWGDSPNGLAVSRNGKYLYVANGMDAAIAVIRLGKQSSSKGKDQKSGVEGFIPTGGYPSSVVLAGKNKMYVTNLEAHGANVPVKQESGIIAYNTHCMLASVSVIEIPGKKDLENHTRKVIAANDLARVQATYLPPRPGTDPQPVPERIGEPSVFKHVIYIIKENRTYDQVLGDIPKGNGEPSLCVFGQEITPNIHRLVNDFVLMDNYMASGKCSAEGHQWTDASIVTDYVEKNVRAWFRSYPHVQTDALVYAPTGFIWDNAVSHGKTVRIYGEAAVPEFDHNLGWKDIYENFKQGKPFVFTNLTTIEPVKPLLSTTYPGYDGHSVPDVLRADVFNKDIKKYDQMEGDQLPELMILALPADHTAGTRPGFPTPRAMVADNDLALGQIIETLSHSKFWKNTVVFVTEDDSQSGWDHVSAYRTVGLVMSAYSRKQEAVHAAYNQPSMVRTIEQILGIPPMNIQDAIAPTMDACFNEVPDLAPYTALENRIPLDEMNPETSALNGKALHYAKRSLDPQFDHIDGGNDNLLNHILWFASRGGESYPARYAGEDDGEDDD